MPPAVSLITVYYNTPEDLLRLSRSLEKQIPRGLYEWIVVDNASEVNLSSALPDAVYLRLESNPGFGAACNRAAAVATAPALFLVNPDCEFVEDCVTPLLAVLEKAAVCGPRVLYPDGSLQLSFGPYLSIGKEYMQKRLMQRETRPDVQKWLAALEETEPDYVSGCALMVRADIFKQAGGFDENFFLYHEDVDLCKRIREAGHSIRYVPSTRIVHIKNTSSAQAPERVSREYRKSQIYYYKKHHGMLQNAMLRLYLSWTGKNA